MSCFRLGMDSYCFHRYFGEIHPAIQTDPGTRMTVWDFLDFAEQLGLDGVSLETVFMPDAGPATLRRLRERLDGLGIDRVWAWGHPSGLRSGADEAAVEDLVANVPLARELGADVMRIVAGDRHTRPPAWRDHREALLRQFEKILPVAERNGVVLAVENHKDLLAGELAELMVEVSSPYLGVCLDTGNNLRLFEDPIEVARTLAPWARAVHLKDITVQPGDPHQTRFWPTVPLGTGLVDVPQVLEILAEASFSGLLAIETDYLHPEAPREHEAVRQSVEYMRGLLAGNPAPVRADKSTYHGVWR